MLCLSISQSQRCWWTCWASARTTSSWATETTGSKKVMSTITLLVPVLLLIRPHFLQRFFFLSLSIYLYIYIYKYSSSYFFQIDIHWSLLHRDQSDPICAARLMLEQLTDWGECLCFQFPLFFSLFLLRKIRKGYYLSIIKAISVILNIIIIFF